MQRGEVWWADLPKPIGHRPVLILSRSEAVQVRDVIIVSQLTTTVRHIPAEVFLRKSDGLPKDCVVNLDVIDTVLKKALTEKITSLSFEKLEAVEKALKFALGLN